MPWLSGGFNRSDKRAPKLTDKFEEFRSVAKPDIGYRYRRDITRVTDKFDGFTHIGVVEPPPPSRPNACDGFAVEYIVRIIM